LRKEWVARLSETVNDGSGLSRLEWLREGPFSKRPSGVADHARARRYRGDSGADAPRALVEKASPGPTRHVFDWFHLAMRLQHAAQTTKSWPCDGETDRRDGAALAECIEHIGWRLWHGQVQRALDLIREKLAWLEARPAEPCAHRLLQHLRDLEVHVASQSASIIDYAAALRPAEPLSSAPSEGLVQRLLHRRMNTKQQMRWSPRGAHLMLKVRTAILNI
jgi:hypothetical protein